MLYKVVEYFGPNSKDKWDNYIEWSGLNWLKSFDSVDGLLRPSLFEPHTEEDWANCVKENFIINYINNVDYALEIYNTCENGILVGMDLIRNAEYMPSKDIIGYDILDECNDISLLTNWGKSGDYPYDRKVIKENGLIKDKDTSIQIRDQLRQMLDGDHHSKECKVWAIYHIK